jgi:hypothetical protein
MRHGERRSGFALLAALWLIVALAVLGAVGIESARTGSLVTRNRVLLARAEWARAACAEILLARYAANPATRAVPPVDLGRRTWCRATVEDPAARLDLNAAPREAVAQVVCATRAGSCPDSLIDAVVSARAGSPLLDPRQLLELPGWDSALVVRLAPFVTTRGTGVINVTSAPAAVLVTLPGFGQEAVFLAVSRQTAGAPLRSLDELAASLSPSGRRAVLAHYAELARVVTFAPPRLVVTVEGGVRGTPIVARGVLMAVPTPQRLAVIRREIE